MICSKVKCPYYKHEDTQMIYCESFYPRTVLHLAFANKAEAKAYKTVRCRAQWEGCPIVWMLEEAETTDEKEGRET